MQEWIIIVTAMTPVSELRGAIPLGIGMGVSPEKSLVLALIGNLVIVPLLLWIIAPLFRYVRSFGRLRDWINRYEARAASKVKHYRGYRLMALFILVAVPLPTTGVYTAAVAATVLKIRFRNAWMAISMGVLAAGLVVYAISSNWSSLVIG